MPERPISLPFSFVVAGVSFRQADVLLCKEGDVVRIKHEPDNEYDRNACAVYNNAGDRLGFVPKMLAGRLILRADENAWRGTVVDVRKGDTWGLEVRVERPYTEPAAAKPTPAPAPASDQRVGRTVRAKSGRVLGTFVSRTDTIVTVENPSGVPIPYPADLVKFDDEVPSAS